MREDAPVTTIFGTLGFTPKKLVPTVRSRSGVEQVVVFHDDHERSQQAAREVRAYCHDLNLPCQTLELDAFNILSCAKEIQEAVEEHRDGDIVFNITGGTPILSSAALLVCLLEGLRAVTVDERTGREIQLPLLAIRYDELLNPAQRRILRWILDHPGATQRDVVDGLGLSKGTVSHHVSNLKARGLLEARTVHDTRTEALHVIESGELLLMGETDA